MPEPTIKEIKDATDIVEIIGRYVTLKRRGASYLGLCPFQGEKTPSFTVSPSKGIFKCMGCGLGGDIFSFLQANGMKFTDALNYLKDPNNNQGLLPTATKKEYVKPEDEWQQIVPRKTFKPDTITHPLHGKPSKIYTYTNIEGETIGYTCRFELEDGRKEVLPFCYMTNGEREGWRWGGFAYPKPLYNLQSLKGNTKPIILVEGEKTCDAAARLFPNYNCLTWIGGSNGILKTNWEQIKGRDIILWPDNDKDKKYTSGEFEGQKMKFQSQPGNKAMLNIYVLMNNCTRHDIKWVKNPKWAECGWDVADANWNEKEANDYLNENIILVEDFYNKLK